MDLHYATMVVFGAAAGGFVNGLAGFGTALFALGFWVQVMPPEQAVAMALAMSVLSGIQGVVLVRSAIEPSRLMGFLLPALLGLPLGVMLLSVLQPTVLKLMIALLLILYGGYFSFSRVLPQLQQVRPVWDATVGFLGGLLGGLAGLSGVLPTMWCALRPWPKLAQRAVLQPFNVVILSVGMVLLAVRGAYTPEVLYSLLLAVPATMLSAQLGISLFKRLADHQFKRLLIGLMFVSGVGLLIRESVEWMGAGF